MKLATDRRKSVEQTGHKLAEIAEYFLRWQFYYNPCLQLGKQILFFISISNRNDIKKN